MFVGIMLFFLHLQSDIDRLPFIDVGLESGVAFFGRLGKVDAPYYDVDVGGVGSIAHLIRDVE